MSPNPVGRNESQTAVVVTVFLSFWSAIQKRKINENEKQKSTRRRVRVARKEKKGKAEKRKKRKEKRLFASRSMQTDTRQIQPTRR